MATPKFRPFNIVFLRHAESFNNTLPHDGNFEVARHHDPPLTERGVAQVTVAGQAIAEMDFQPPVSLVLTSYLHRALRTGLAVQEAVKGKKKGSSTPSQNSDDLVADRDPRITPAAVGVEVWKDIHENGGCYKVTKSKESEGGEQHEEKSMVVGLPGRTGAQVLAEFPTFTLRPDEGGCPEGWWDLSADGQEKGKEPHPERRARCLKAFHDFCWRIGGPVVEKEEDRERDKNPQDATVVVITHGYFYHSMLKAWMEEGWLKGEGLTVESIEVLNNASITHLRFVVAAEKKSADDEGSGSNNTTKEKDEDGQHRHPPYEVKLVFQNNSNHLESSGVGCCVPLVGKNFNQ